MVWVLQVRRSLLKSHRSVLLRCLTGLVGGIFPSLVLAADSPSAVGWQGIVALLVFVLAMALVITEEVTQLKKSKPVIVAAGFIWLLASLQFMKAGKLEELEVLFEHNLLEFAELFLFLLAAI